jgi:hypothetical protein
MRAHARRAASIDEHHHADRHFVPSVLLQQPSHHFVTAASKAWKANLFDLSKLRDPGLLATHIDDDDDDDEVLQRYTVSALDRSTTPGAPI